MKKPKTMSLRQVKTFNQVCRLPRDHYEINDFCIMTDGRTLWLIEQKFGKKATQAFAIRKSIFDKLLVAYDKPRKVSFQNG